MLYPRIWMKAVQAILRPVRIPCEPPVHNIHRTLSTWMILCIAWEAVQLARQECWQTWSLTIADLDCSSLLTGEIRRTHRAGEVFDSLLIYYAGAGLATAGVKRIIYPYENRAWEKLLILGVRAVNPQVRLIGYQHAAITASHLNFTFHDEQFTDPLPASSLSES